MKIVTCLYNVSGDQGVRLKRYVIQETAKNRVTFYFRSPHKGIYYVTVYARRVSTQ